MTTKEAFEVIDRHLVPVEYSAQGNLKTWRGAGNPDGVFIRLEDFEALRESIERVGS